MAWDKEALTKLYHEDKMTLQDIANKFGVTRQRVQQVMWRLRIPRRIAGRGVLHKTKYGNKTRFKSLDEYLLNSAQHNRSRNFDGRTVRKYLPPTLKCAECHHDVPSNEMHIHHIVYPAQSIKDIQVLCRSCHKMRHRGKMTFVKQVSVFGQFMQGASRKELATLYNVTQGTIYSVILKIGNDSPSLRDALNNHSKTTSQLRQNQNES